MTFHVNRRCRVFEGRGKVLFEGPEPDTLVQYFKDDISDRPKGEEESAAKKQIMGKGALNNRISEFLMSRLNEIGVATHFIKRVNMREQLVHQLEMMPLQVIVHNVADADFAKRYGGSEGMLLPRAITEYYYKKDDLGSPMVSEDHIKTFGLALPGEVEEIEAMVTRINDHLTGIFMGAGLRLVNVRLEFGRRWDEDDDLETVLADELTPDTCHLWDVRTNEKFVPADFGEDLDSMTKAYQEVGRRLGILPEGLPEKETPIKPVSNLVTLKERA